MKSLQKCLLAIGLLFANFCSAESVDLTEGQVKQFSSEFQAWNAEKKSWLKIEDFWRAYANRQGGLTWGERSDYPPYDQVKEFDTLIIQLPQGNCMMMFFHSRWRRANDVRRWDDVHNDYGGCPFVFD